jgi:hypothetical protein
MDYVTAIAIFVLALFSYMLGRGSANGDIFCLKRENERLNAELKTRTDRDERGRFTGSKTK